MNKQSISTQETAAVLAQMLPWRQTLFERILRVVAIIGVPVLLVGGYYIFATGRMGYLALALVGYTVVLVGAFMPRVPYVWRVWALIGILAVLGASDLFTYGWGEDGRMYLMTATLFAAIFLGGIHSVVMLIVSYVIIALFVVMVILGLVSPGQHLGADYASATLTSGLIVFIGCTTALFVSFNNLLPRIFASLQRSAQLSTDLETRQQELAERMRALQDSNLSLQRRATYMDANAQVMWVLMQTLGIEPVLEQAAQLISRNFDFSHVAIFLTDETGMWLELRAASSSVGRLQLAQGHRLRRDGESAPGYVAETRKSYVARRGVGKALDVAYFAQPGLPETHVAALFPLVVAGEVLGVLDIRSVDETSFDLDSLRILESLAWQVAIALDNARRLGAEDSVLEAVNPFYRLTQRLGTTHTEADVYTAILDIVQGFRPARAYIVQPAAGASDAYLVTDLRGAQLNVQRVAASGETEHFGAALAMGKTLETPLLISDLTAPPAVPTPDFRAFCNHLAQDVENRSVALMPLRAGAEFYGVLMVIYNVAHRFATLETQVYRVIGDFAGVTLEKITLLREAQMRLGQERWLREFSERVQQTPDLQVMLARAAQSLQDVVAADGVTAALTLPQFSVEREP